MKHIVKEEKKEIVVRDEYWIAYDGKEFATRKDCENHEKDLKKKQAHEKIEPYIIEELMEQIPIHADANFTYCSHYEWYRIPNKEALQEIEDFYDTHFIEPKLYPGILCVETENEEYYGEPYWYNLDNMFSITKKFFNALGYKVEFSKEKDI